MLDLGERPILTVSGNSGIGKTSLLARFVHECALRRMTKVEIDCSSLRYSTYLAIMRKVRDDLGADHFKKLTDLINYFTVPEYRLQLNVSTDANIVVSQDVGTVEAGAEVNISGITIRDAMFVVSREDLSVSEDDRLTKLTDRFLTDLERFLAATPAVIFFDHLDKATSETRRWIWSELLGPIAHGRLHGARFVLCGREPPKLDEELAHMRGLVEQATLQPLGVGDIAEYVARRDEFNLDEGERKTIADMLFVVSEGVPFRVASYVDGFLQLRRRGA
jgi:hypothetical protein